jgi:hypothetical protein
MFAAVTAIRLLLSLGGAEGVGDSVCEQAAKAEGMREGRQLRALAPHERPPFVNASGSALTGRIAEL